MGIENTHTTVYIHEIYPLIEEFSDIDLDNDFNTLTQLSVSDNDSGEDQTPIVSLSSGSTPLVSDSIFPPTTPVQHLEQASSDDFSTISNLFLKINQAADALGDGPVDSSSRIHFHCYTPLRRLYHVVYVKMTKTGTNKTLVK